MCQTSVVRSAQNLYSMASINCCTSLLDLCAQACLDMRALSSKCSSLSLLNSSLFQLSQKCNNNPQRVCPPYPNRLNEEKVKGHLIQWLRLDEMITKEGVTHHSKLIPEKYELAFSQIFSEYVCNLLICRYVLYLNCSSLNIIQNEVISNLNVLRPIVKNWNLREFDTTLIVTVNHSGSQLHTK
jgi:hypothetical protein